MNFPKIDSFDAARAKRVLIINVTRIGDTLLATPAIRAIARFFPNAQLTVLGHPKRVEVIENLPYVARVGHIEKQGARWRGWADVLRGPEYDFAFVWRQDEALVRYALRKARHVIAHQQHDATLNGRLFAAVPPPLENSVHAVAWALSLPRAVGVPDAEFELDYAVTRAESDAATKRLVLAGASQGGPLITFQVASFPTKPYRDWPIEHFIGLAQRILGDYPNAVFLLNGAASDRARIEQFIATVGPRALSFAGVLSLRESVAMMSLSQLYVGVDTGPTHLFSALKKPMVAMYHPSHPSGIYKPLAPANLFVIDHPRAGSLASHDIPMADIAVDLVWQAARAALNGERSELHGGTPPGL